MAATPTNDAQRQPPAIPPSPTLTNPDMILPEDEGERESQTPSPPFNLPSLSHLQAFYGYTNNNNTLNPNNDNDNDNHLAVVGASSSIGVAYPLANTGNTRPSSKKNFSRHTGHRLSDIGEEDGPGPVPPPRSSSRTGRFPVNTPSTGQDWRGMAGSPATRNWKGEEIGMVNDGGQSSQQWQGSDQKAVPGKVHSLHMGVNDMNNHNANGRGGTPLAPVAEGGGPGEESSSVILSSEAERILDNAKKRLTLMEGNLTRARSSMRSPSMSASASPSPQLGLGQPVGGLYRTISNSDRQASAALRPRPMYSTYQDAAGNRHSRVLSETNLPSGQNASTTEVNGISRSVSAMGTTTLSRDDKSFRYEPTRAYLTHRASTPLMQQHRSSPALNSNSSRSKQSTPTSPAGLGIVSDGENQAKINNIDDFNSVYPADPPSRTQSQLQVRDLQDQMKGLHIKISSLKVKAQEDGLRRRSLQSLRTPSPLTDAESWYTRAMDYKDRRGHLSPNPTGSRLSFESAREVSRRTPSSQSQSPRTVESDEPVIASESKKIDTSPQISEQPSNESLYQDAEEGEFDDSDDTEIDREELNEILQEPLDDDLDDPALEPFPGTPNADATPHEEREDAFDYEHFILHSALGNYSRSKLRRASNISNSSVETTRPAHNHSTRHSRANSGASISTDATFATAAEEGDFNGVLYWDRKFNDELRARHHYSPSDEDIPIDPKSFPEEEMGTPNATRREPPGRVNGYIPTSTGSLEPPRPRSDTTGSATPTALASSLVSTVRAASSSPYSPIEPNTGLNNDDERLLEQLFQSLGNVCMDLQNITTGPEPDEKVVRVLRRRLDAARRVLDGELDA